MTQKRRAFLIDQLRLQASMNALGAFFPELLFAQGEQGVLYDPSDLSTMFQDVAGTIPVTAAGQPVGRINDKSRGLVLGPQLVTNGDFSNGSTGWTLTSSSVVNGALDCSTVSGQILAFRNITVVAGRTYQMSFTVTNYTSGAVGLQLGVGTNVSTPTVNANGVFTSLLVAGAGNAEIRVVSTGLGFVGTVDNVSVRELSGNHARQSTAGSRPIYSIAPLTGVRNRLTYSEKLDTVWAVNGATVAQTGNNWRVTKTAATGTIGHVEFVDALLFDSVGVAYADVIKGNTTFAALHSKRTFMNANDRRVIFNLDTKTVSSTWNDFAARPDGGDPNFPGGGRDAGVIDLGNGVLRLWVYFRGSLTPGTLTNFAIVPCTDGDNLTVGASGIYVDVVRTQVELGTAPTAYQRVVTAREVTEAGVPSLSYLFFDGTDDSLFTSTINPGSVDKAQVFAGVRKLSDAARGIIAEFSDTIDANNGAFNLTAPNAASNTFAFESRGTTLTDAVGSGFTAPLTRVLTGLGDIAGDRTTLRVNGSQADQDTGDQGTGNYGSYALRIGSRGGSSLRFSGWLYGLIVRFSSANLDDATIAQAETWMNGKTGAY